MREEAGKAARLGRGLAALLGDVDGAFPPSDTTQQRRIPIEFLRRNPRNPRSHFAEAELDELAASIRERGVIQPILVRPVPDLPDAYEIVAGERRWRAAQRAGLHDMPAVVVEADDRLALEYAIIENVQRADLNAAEEAAGYERLIADHGYSQSELGNILGKSRSHVANTLRLLKLPDGVLDDLRAGRLSAGHARALLAVRDPAAVARAVIEGELNVRDVERIAQDEANQEGHDRPRRADRRSAIRDPDTRALETSLERSLGLTVRIDDKAGRGELRIRYSDLEQLDSLCRRLQAC